MRPFVRKLLAVLALVALLATGVEHVGAAVPQAINYQGYLTDAGGQPVNGSVYLSFGLYTAASGGSSLWSETQEVTVANGVFSVRLGSTYPIGLAFDVPYFLGVGVNFETEMTPRQALASAPYSLRTLRADSVADNAITGAAIVNQSVPPSKLSGPACAIGDALRFSGVQWTCVPPFSGALSSPPTNDYVLNYNSFSGGVNWRKPVLQCFSYSASADFAINAVGYVVANCPAGKTATGGSFSSGNRFGITIDVVPTAASCYFHNTSGSAQTFYCAVQCCSIGF